MTACSHSLEKEDLTCPSFSLLHDGELHQNTPLTHLFPENHWSTGWVGRGGGLLERCKNKWGGAAAEWTWGTSDSKGGGSSENESKMQKESVMQLPCRLQCTMSGPGGCRREREREGERHRDGMREWDRAHHNRQRTGNSTIINPHSDSLSLGS